MDRTKALKLLRLSEPFSSAELEAAYSTRLGNIHADFQDQVKIAYGFLADELQKTSSAPPRPATPLPVAPTDQARSFFFQHKGVLITLVLFGLAALVYIWPQVRQSLKSPEPPIRTITEDGKTFTGHIRSGKPHGAGTLSNKEGTKMVGTWDSGKKHGQFTETYAEEGATKTGKYVQGKKQGIHTITTENVVITIMYKDDVSHGPFTRQYTSKNLGPVIRVSGMYENNKMVQGTINYKDKSQYVGEIGEKETRHGQGKYILANGIIHEGVFENDLRHGPGIEINPDGNRFKGTWTHDVLSGEVTITYPTGLTKVTTYVNGKEGNNEEDTRKAIKEFLEDSNLYEFHNGNYESPNLMAEADALLEKIKDVENSYPPNATPSFQDIYEEEFEAYTAAKKELNIEKITRKAIQKLFEDNQVFEVFNARQQGKTLTPEQNAVVALMKEEMPKILASYTNETPSFQELLEEETKKYVIPLADKLGLPRGDIEEVPQEPETQISQFSLERKPCQDPSQINIKDIDVKSFMRNPKKKFVLPPCPENSFP